MTSRRMVSQQNDLVILRTQAYLPTDDGLSGRKLSGYAGLSFDGAWAFVNSDWVMAQIQQLNIRFASTRGIFPRAAKPEQVMALI